MTADIVPAFSLESGSPSHPSKTDAAFPITLTARSHLGMRGVVRIFLIAGFRFFAVAAMAAGGPDLTRIASAADLPMVTKAAPIVARTWDGCYAGVQLGGTYGRSHWREDGESALNSGNGTPQVLDQESFQQLKTTVGGQAGCNLSYNGPWMLGMEVGLLATPMDRAQNNNVIFDVGTGISGNVRTEIRSIISATARFGFSPTPDWLLYSKAGYAGAFIHTSASIADRPELEYNNSNWHHGWTVGAGFEYRLFRNVSIGAEYNYYRFENKNYSQAFPVSAPSNPVLLRAGAEVQSAMARINFYSPDSPAARVAAAYSSPGFSGRFSSFVNTSTQYSEWEGPRGPNVFRPDRGRGYQVYSPVSLGVDYDEPTFKLEARAKGGYVYTAQRTSGQTAFYSGPVDTQTSFNVVLLNFDNVRPQFGVNFNLPTGTSYLPNNQRFTRVDPDLAPIGAYGQGFNLNPTAGFVIGLDQNTAASLSAGYAWQGQFVREGADVNTPGPGVFHLKQYVDPGDVVTANFNITTQVGNTTILGSFAFMSESSVTINGIESGRAGAKYVSNLTLNTQIDEKRDIATNVSWSFQEKNDINIANGLVTEPKNSNSHVVIGSIDPGYMVTDRLRASVNYSFLWRDENFYDQIEGRFIPAKQKHTVGVGGRYFVNETSSIDLRSGYSWIQQDASSIVPVVPLPTVAAVPPQMNFTAWTVSTAANIRF